jgi:hypothetical protein
MRTVELKLFQDDANGEYGVAHSNSIDRRFNAFWNGIGIFHDVFEHWFEETHPYFKGDYAFNIGGEVAAMGACLYYYGIVGDLRRLNPRNIYSFDHNCIYSTHYAMIEAMTEAQFDFGNRFLSAIPEQKPGPYMLESMISEHWYMIEEAKKEKQIRGWASEWKNECLAYRRSLTYKRLRNLYRWGWRMAEEHAEDRNESEPILTDFIIHWEAFCRQNPASELYGAYSKLVFEVQTDGTPYWDAYFINRYSRERVHWKDAPDLIYADPYD